MGIWRQIQKKKENKGKREIIDALTSLLKDAAMKSLKSECSNKIVLPNNKWKLQAHTGTCTHLTGHQTLCALVIHNESELPN